MPKYRQLYTKVIDSFDFNEMPDDFTRLVWLLLPLILDGEGRGIDNIAWIKSRLFPLRVDVTIEQLQAAFTWMIDRKMIIEYQVDDHPYFYVPTFKKYQKGTEHEASSVLPSPPSYLEPTLIKDSTNFEVGAIKDSQNNIEVDLLASASASESAYESESASESESPLFERIKSHIEQLTGILAIPAFIKPIEEIIAFGGTEADITAGYGWFRDNNDKPFKYYGQLVDPTRTAMSKRLGGNGKKPGKHRYDTAEAREKYRQWEKRE